MASACLFQYQPSRSSNLMISRTFMDGTVTYRDAALESGTSDGPLLVPGSAHGLDKGDLIDLLQGCKSTAHLVQCRFAKEAHAVFAGGAPDFGSWLPLQNHLAYAVGQIQKLVNGVASAESGAGAPDAALTLIQRALRPNFRVEAARFEHLIRIMHGGAARIADDPPQPLRQNAVQRRDKVIGLDSHVQEAAQSVN